MKKTFVTFSDIKYIVKPEEGIVICSMSASANLCQLGRNNLNYSFDWIVNKFPNVDYYNGKFKVKGIAKCDKDDTFNVVLGKRIAESKAKHKAFKRVTVIHNWIIKKFYEKLKMYEEIISNCERAAETEITHINSLVAKSEKKGE